MKLKRSLRQPLNAREPGRRDSNAHKGRALRVLYLFAGKPRRGDIRSHLSRLCKQHGIILVMEEIDIARGADPAYDAANDATWRALMEQIDQGYFDIVLLSPPCEGFFPVEVLKASGAGPGSQQAAP